MSTAPSSPGNPSTIPDPASYRRQEIRIIRHCSLFYWWPVWAVGFVMFAISMFDGHRLAVVPAGTTEHRELVELAPTEEDKKNAAAKKIDPVQSKRDALVYPLGHQIPLEAAHLHMSNNKNLGVLFCIVLLLVILVTNIPMRGLWSFIVILSLVTLSVIFAWLEWWNTILLYLNFLDIRINAAGYLVISSVLFVAWLIVLLLFDQQMYMVFTPGLLRVCLEIGDGETVYPTAGLMVQKKQSDFFRHWILGIGSGDLIVKPGANVPELRFSNVLFIGMKLKKIERMMAEVPVVAGGAAS